MDIGSDTVDRAVVSNTKGPGLESRLLPLCTQCFIVKGSYKRTKNKKRGPGMAHKNQSRQMLVSIELFASKRKL